MWLPIKYEEREKGQEKYQHLKGGQAEKPASDAKKNNEKKTGEAREEGQEVKENRVSRGDNIKSCRKAKPDGTEKGPVIWRIISFVTLVISVEWWE